MLHNWGLQGGTLTEDLEIAFTLPFKKIVLKKKFEAEYGREEKLDNSNP